MNVEYIVRSDGHNSCFIATRDGAIAEFNDLRNSRKYAHLEVGMRYHAANGDQRFVTIRRWSK